MCVGNRSSGFRESQPPPPHRRMAPSKPLRCSVDARRPAFLLYLHARTLPLRCGSDFHVLCLMLFLLTSAAAWALV